MARRRYWNEAKAARELSAWGSSGLSLTGYARREGLHVERLRRWKHRLQVSGGGGEAGLTQTFLPVRIVAGTAEGSGAFEIVLGEPVRVRVPGDFDAAALRRLLGALSGC
mgnify:CR=1 FL=1